VAQSLPLQYGGAIFSWEAFDIRNHVYVKKQWIIRQHTNAAQKICAPNGLISAARIGDATYLMVKNSYNSKVGESGAPTP
jgi:hypothetical protein